MSKFKNAEDQYKKLQDLQQQRAGLIAERDKLAHARPYIRGVGLDIRPELGATSRLNMDLPYIDFRQPPFDNDFSIIQQIIDSRLEYLRDEIERLNQELD